MQALPTQLEAFASRLEEIYGEGGRDRILSTMGAPKRAGFYCNPLRSSSLRECASPHSDLGDVPAQALTGLPGFAWVEAEARQDLVRSESVAAGRRYPMNPASFLAPLLLAPEPGEEVLDLAAAPGGKTLIMAGLMQNRGRIAAVEPVKGRFHRMRANLERCGATIVQSYLDDGRRIGRKVPGRFDRVLLDAPCSSEARIRLDDPASYRHWAPKKIRETARKQRGLIRSAYAALKPGGRLLYSTCAFSPEENEQVVSYLLASETGARVLPLADAVSARVAVMSQHPSWVSGLDVWQSKRLDPRVAGAVRILPDDLWDGFFLCLIAKDAS